MKTQEHTPHKKAPGLQGDSNQDPGPLSGILINFKLTFFLLFEDALGICEASEALSLSLIPEDTEKATFMRFLSLLLLMFRF